MSTGTIGLIFFGSTPLRSSADLKAAKSTTLGTAVKSCIIILPGLNGSSDAPLLSALHLASDCTSLAVTEKPSSVRKRASSKTRKE